MGSALPLVSPGIPSAVGSPSVTTPLPTQPGVVAAIMGHVYRDANANGVLDAGESGLGGVAVSLKGDDSTSFSTQTDSLGNYGFYHLTYATYHVSAVTPTGMALTGGTVNPVTLSASHVSAVVDVGFMSPTVTAGVTIGPIGDQQNTEGDAVSLQVSATTTGSATLSYSAAGLLKGLTINPTTGKIGGTLAVGSATLGPQAVTVTASDGKISASTSFKWTVRSSPPTLDPIDDRTNAVGDAVDHWVNANDVNGNPLTFTVTGLPTGLAIDSASGEITGTVANSAYRTTPYAVTVTASDGTLCASQSFVWNVTAILLTNPGDQSGAIGALVSLPILAQDVSGGTLSYSATGLPAGLSINPTTGSITGMIAAGTTWNASYGVFVSATNGTDTAIQVFDWTVTAASGTTAPTVTDPGPQSGLVGDVVSLPFIASSAAGSLTYSAVGLPDGLAMNPTTGIISGTLTSNAVGTTGVTVTVIDPAGGTASDKFSWSVNSRVAIGPFADQQNAEGDAVSFQVSATTVSSSPLVYSAVGLANGLTINATTGFIGGTLIAGTATQGLPLAVTVTATDGTYSASTSFNWTIDSVVVAPELVAQSHSFSVVQGQTLAATGNGTAGSVLLAKAKVPRRFRHACANGGTCCRTQPAERSICGRGHPIEHAFPGSHDSAMAR